jgi:hypothetical protein
MFNSKCPSNLPVDDDKTKVLEDLKSYPRRLDSLSEVLADSCYRKLLGKTPNSLPKFRLPFFTNFKKIVLTNLIKHIIKKYIIDNPGLNALKIIDHIIDEDKTNEDKTDEDKTDEDKTNEDKTNEDKTNEDKTNEDKTNEDKTNEDKTYTYNLETRLKALKSVITSHCLNKYDVIKKEVLKSERKKIALKNQQMNYDNMILNNLETTSAEDNLTQTTNTENNLTQASIEEDNLTPEQVRNNIIFIDKEIADGINTESKHKTDNFTIKDLKSHKLEYLLIKEIENYNEDKDKILKIEIILNINTTYYKFIYYNIFKSLYLNKIYKLNNYQNQTLQIYPPENEDSLFTSKVDPFLYIYNNLICTEENKLNKIIEDCSKNVTISCIYIKYYITKKITKENGGFKLKTKNKINKVSKKSIKENKYKEVLGKRMKIYKKPDSRKEFVRYKGGLVPLVEYKKTMKEIVRAKNKKH